MRRSIVILMLLGVLLTACGQAANTPGAIALTDPTPLPTAVAPVTDLASLADALRASGAFVTHEGDVSQDFLQADGAILRVDDQRLQVYEYPDDSFCRER